MHEYNIGKIIFPMSHHLEDETHYTHLLISNDLLSKPKS